MDIIQSIHHMLHANQYNRSIQIDHIILLANIVIITHIIQEYGVAVIDTPAISFRYNNQYYQE